MDNTNYVTKIIKDCDLQQYVAAPMRFIPINKWMQGTWGSTAYMVRIPTREEIWEQSVSVNLWDGWLTPQLRSRLVDVAGGEACSIKKVLIMI